MDFCLHSRLSGQRTLIYYNVVQLLSLRFSAHLGEKHTIKGSFSASIQYRHIHTRTGTSVEMVAMKPFLFSRYTRIHMRATHLHFPHSALPLPGQRVAWCPTAACVVVDTIEPTTHTQTQNTQNSSPPRDGYTDTHGTGENFALGPKRMDGEMRSLTTVAGGWVVHRGWLCFCCQPTVWGYAAIQHNFFFV